MGGLFSNNKASILATAIIAVLLATVAVAGIKLLDRDSLTITGAAVAGCTGTSYPCMHYSADNCGTIAGCSWTWLDANNMGCNGTAKACPSYTDSASCKQSNNCTWYDATETSCTDGKDNDGNGKIDCNDPACCNYDGTCKSNSKCNSSCGASKVCEGNSPGGHLTAPNCAADNPGLHDGCGAYCIVYDNGTTCNSVSCAADSECNGKAPGACSSTSGYLCASNDCKKTAAANAETNCSDGKDNDCNGLIDCADHAQCNGRGSCQGNESTCNDAFDNDANGLTDCKDKQCDTKSCGTNSTCSTGATLVSSCDRKCSNLACAACSTTCKETNCADGIDNNGNGNTDCADLACDGVGNCENPKEKTCNDSVDNNGDTRTDCADYDCYGKGYCEPLGANRKETNCTDGKDNDGNGKIDCKDSACCNADGTCKKDNLCYNDACGAATACNGIAPNSQIYIPEISGGFGGGGFGGGGFGGGLRGGGFSVATGQVILELGGLGGATQYPVCTYAGNKGIYDMCNSTCQPIDKNETICRNSTYCSAAGACKDKAIGACSTTSGQKCGSDCSLTAADNTETSCTDGIDNDCNGAIDLNDTACCIDLDGDKYNATAGGVCGATADCDDTNSSVHPGATEVCNGIDDNCINGIDEGCECTPPGSKQACGPPEAGIGLCANGNQTCENGNWSDCVGATYPIPEICNSEDDNCNNQTDEGVLITSYRDFDVDNYGNLTDLTEACTVPDGYVDNSLDCNDFSSSANPGLTEICDRIDNNCNGIIDENCTCVPNDVQECGVSSVGECKLGSQTCLEDATWGECEGAVFPVNETCNNKDDNCNTLVDENLTEIKECGLGICAGGTQTRECINGTETGWGACSTADKAVNETCNGADDDCDGNIDNGLPNYTFYKDSDIDGYGDPSITVQACAAPEGYANRAGDCNDANKAVNPGATEICTNNIDDNCNGLTDAREEGCGQQVTGGSSGGGGTSYPLNKTVMKEVLPVYKPGDGICDIGETPLNDPKDCGCKIGQKLVGAKCVSITITEEKAVCGNHIVEGTEVCDGTDASQCPGACNSDCTCRYIVGDGFCDKAAGENVSNSPDDCKFRIPGAMQLGLVFATVIGGIGGAWWVQKRRRTDLEDLTIAHGADAPLSVPPEEASGTVESYINHSLSEGYRPEEVKEILVSRGWDPNLIDKKMMSASKDIKALGDSTEVYKVEEPHNDLSKLRKYVNHAMDEGYTPVQIKTALTTSGWDEKTIEDVFAKHEDVNEELTKLAKKHNVHKPSAEKEEKLGTFVKASLRKGHTPTRIKKALQDVGWTMDAVSRNTKI